MRRRNLFAAPALAFPPAGHAAGRAAPVVASPVAVPPVVPSLVVVELFTSQSCSSCPPADAFLEELVRGRPEVLALSFHVTYWNRLGWRDRFSLEEATARQPGYAATLGHGQVYTPQMVVQGRQDAVGSDRRAVLAAIGDAAPAAVAVAIAPSPDGGAVRVEAAAGAVAGSAAGTLWLLGYDRRQATPVGGGENGGRTLAHANVVRGIVRLGAWRGERMQAAGARPPGERLAALVQAADGAILGAATA